MPHSFARFRINTLAAALAAALAVPVWIAAPGVTAAPPVLTGAQALESRDTYIVLLAEAPLATYAGGVAGIAAAPRSRVGKGPAKLDARAAQSRAYVAYLSHRQAAWLGTASASLKRPLQALYTYTHALNGIALELTESEAAALARMAGVLSVRKSGFYSLATDAGPRWIGAPALWDGTRTGADGTRGEGIVIGVIDSGINFDSPSFAAVDADGYHHVNPRGAGEYLGTCAPGGADAGRCTDKLIGARYLLMSIPAGSPDRPDTAADFSGHGSHTASTAGGNRTEATTADLATAMISGVAPRANLIAYKACYQPPPRQNGGCPFVATAAAVDQAVVDGVDVINFSISGGTSPWADDTSIAFRNAMAAGIVVAAAAGNTPTGAVLGSVNHAEPWTVTVAASTHDRLYSNAQVEVPGLGTLAAIKALPSDTGQSLLADPVSGPLAVSRDDPSGCTAFAPAPATPGFIAVLPSTDCSYSVKVNHARAAGAAAVITYQANPLPPSTMLTPGTTIPALMVSAADGEALLALAQAAADTRVTVDASVPPTFAHEPGYADVLPSFSNVGPAGGVNAPLDLLKPDVSAPGVSILAAIQGDADAVGFMSGTSMAAPHVAGSAALLRALHPDWTPMEIKSALMLTASQALRRPSGSGAATPLEIGAGRVELTRVAGAPLVMDESAANMLAANPATGGNPATLNLASLGEAACAGTCTFVRTFRNPGTLPQTFTAAVTPAHGSRLSGSVAPATFTVEPGAVQSTTITIDARVEPTNGWAFGEVVLTPAAGAPLRLPVAVRNSEAMDVARIVLAPVSIRSTQAPGQTQTRRFTLTNEGAAALTWAVGEEPARVTLAMQGAPAGTNDTIDLQLDHGPGNTAVGAGSRTSFLFLNRFTPQANELPFTLDRIDLQFMAGLSDGSQAVLPGERFDLYVYQDDDGDPSNGARVLGSARNVEANTRGNQLQSVRFPGIVVRDPGDVLIAVVARDVYGGRPATIDSGPSIGRSWLGGLNGVVIADPPDLRAAGLVRIEAASATLNGNLVLRGHGTRGVGPCTALGDVPWLRAAPAEGTTDAGASSEVTLTLDATGLAPGNYDANVCVTSNDVEQPMASLPVSMTVTVGPASDVIFENGFEDGAD